MKCRISHQSLIVKLCQPRPQSEDPDILGRLEISHTPRDIIHMLLIFRFFLTMAIPVAIDIVTDEITENRRDQNNENQDRLHCRQNQNIGQKSQSVDREIRQGFCRRAVGTDTIRCLGKKLGKMIII